MFFFSAENESEIGSKSFCDVEEKQIWIENCTSRKLVGATSSEFLPRELC